MDHRALLEAALEEAREGLAEGGIPIGAALFDASGALLGRGHNQRVQRGDPSAHGETEAFRNAGRRRSYRDTIMVTTLAPCWYCSGLVRQFGIGTVVVGESRTFQGGIDWLRECGVTVIDLDSRPVLPAAAVVHLGPPRRVERGHRGVTQHAGSYGAAGQLLVPFRPRQPAPGDGAGVAAHEAGRTSQRYARPPSVMTSR